MIRNVAVVHVQSPLASRTPDRYNARDETTLYRVTTLLGALAILLVGHGLQMTLLPLHAEALGWSRSAIAATGSAYFAGFFLGCALNPLVLARVGHIRTFMVMAAFATIALLLAGLHVEWHAWLAFRGMTGFAFAGLYMVLESWLNETSPTEARGTVLGVYTMICLLGMAFGQMLIQFGTPGDLRLFVIGGAILCLAIVPVGLTTIASPAPVPKMRVRLVPVFHGTHVAVGGALLAGLVTGPFWMLGPLLGRDFGLDSDGVALLMGCGILGGAVSQLPAGRMSDRVDRRVVIGTLAGIGAVTSALAFAFSDAGTAVLYAGLFVLGAATMPLYGLCVALAGDRTDIPLVEVASTTLMMLSAGSIAGPLVVAPLMARFGPASYFAFVGIVLMTLAAWVAARIRATQHIAPAGAHGPIMPRTTQAVAALAPVAEDDRSAAHATIQDDGSRHAPVERRPPPE